jgi:hypothetical protein
MCVKNANSLEDAVQQFYENPDKYLANTLSSKSEPGTNAKGTTTALLPPQGPPSRQWYPPHTNIVSEAGHIRAQDEVRCSFAMI